MDVGGVIVPFLIGCVDSCLKVECDIQQVNLFEVDFDCYSQAMILKNFADIL